MKMFLQRIRENAYSVWLMTACAFLLGMVFGFFLSPVKKGVTIGSNNHVVNKEDDYAGCVDWTMDYDEDAMEFSEN